MVIIDRVPQPAWDAPAGLTSGRSTARGDRVVAADAAGVQVVGQRFAAVVADGIGDTPEAAHAATIAVQVAMEVAASAGAWEAIRAAGAAVRDLRRPGMAAGDCVLTVAAGVGDRWSVAWVGDCRAYAVVRGYPQQLTTDHTVAEYMRAHGVTPAPHYEHVVTTTAGTAEPGEIGWFRGPRRWKSIVLLSDGVHRALDTASIGAVVLPGRDAAMAARHLTAAALAAGATDNVGAVVISRPISRPAPAQ